MMRARAPSEGSGEPKLLRKGLEEEVYTGTLDGEVIGLSHRIAADLPGFATEPDARNVEYTTAPYRDYKVLVDRLMAKRCRLRRYLMDLDLYTLVPGSTLSLEESDEFRISNHDNLYYRFIAETYGTTVVTASTHINLGIEDSEELIRVYRVLRCEAAIWLALTASSPFLRGLPTGYHSTRWKVFPMTPPGVPFFRDHLHFVEWVESKLVNREMYNPRHLWLSVRPNGPASPRELSRLELRICDRISQPKVIAAMVGLAEARIWQALEEPGVDPLDGRTDQELQELARRNEVAAAESSLEAPFVDWRTGTEHVMRDWIAAFLEQVRPVARAHGFEEVLEAVTTILDQGNLAQRWLAQHATGMTPREILAEAIQELTAIDREYDPACPAPS
ncbi:MAG TPA: glutamate--cysteine ligase [Thermoanaerobaculia bacterium]|nr:glutamate--cysteine ligase [Thermoanaerobaculia bacterium]